MIVLIVACGEFTGSALFLLVLLASNPKPVRGYDYCSNTIHYISNYFTDLTCGSTIVLFTVTARTASRPNGYENYNVRYPQS